MNSPEAVFLCGVIQPLCNISKHNLMEGKIKHVVHPFNHKKKLQFQPQGSLAVLLYGHWKTGANLFLNIDTDVLFFLYPKVIKRIHPNYGIESPERLGKLNAMLRKYIFGIIHLYILGPMGNLRNKHILLVTN